MNPSTYPYPSNSSSASTAAPNPPSTMPSGTQPEQREARAQDVRNRLSGSLKELGQRWKNMTNLKDVKNQLRHHPLATALGSAAVVLMIGGVTIGVIENQRRKTFSYRFKKGIQSAKDMFHSHMD